MAQLHPLTQCPSGRALHAVLVHGGADRPYGATHPLCRWAAERLHCRAVHALALPLHGPGVSPVEAAMMLASTSAAHRLQLWLDDVLRALAPALAAQVPLVFLAYSLGGLTILRLVDALATQATAPVTVVCLGAALSVETTASFIAQFWVLDTWYELSRVCLLIRAHGSGQ